MNISDIFKENIGIGGVVSLLWFLCRLPNYFPKFIEIVLQFTADVPAVSARREYTFKHFPKGSTKYFSNDEVKQYIEMGTTTKSDFCQNFSFGSIPSDLERMSPFLAVAMERVPVTKNVAMET